ncbi:hypothetical protein Ade02nite_53140 [Paractinoplanes deccanensis]|uniref:Uncharacterized protein n=1 Tax=Paractinoplanes deccanensis TaxID=113561 RepID=A0ABQ3Y9I3_9ACTN|nr:hypothetical protein [Actinoplanes deccanensis]GID76673.1 hypothetical protein Ade02nite_53140 [Actinoplanes deccanensis]
MPPRRRLTGHRAGPRRRAAAPPLDGLDGSSRRNEVLSSAAVILAGVLLVIGFGFVATRAMVHQDEPPADPPAPALGDVQLPSVGPQGLIPLGSPSPSPSPAAPKSPVFRSPTPPPATVRIEQSAVPAVVDLSAEGTADWVHWGLDGTFSLERDSGGGFKILEGAPTAPRFRHELSPQKFTWTGGSPVASSTGTPTGIRTCGKGNGFTLSAPAGTTPRTLRLYVGSLAARGKLTARLSTGAAGASMVLDQRTGTLRTAVLAVTYQAPKSGQVQLTWTTDAAYGNGCGGVALEAATLR